MVMLLLGQTLTGLYVNNDVANEGPLTELSPAPIANMMAALHNVLLWDALLAAVALHVLAILVWPGQTARFAPSDDHRSKDAAGQRAGPMRDASNTRACLHRLRGRRGRGDRVLPMTVIPRRHLL